MHFKYAVHAHPSPRPASIDGHSHPHSLISLPFTQKAESHFIQASKPREAIDMWLHQQDFAAAMRVAEGHDAASVRDVQGSGMGAVGLW